MYFQESSCSENVLIISKYCQAQFYKYLTNSLQLLVKNYQLNRIVFTFKFYSKFYVGLLNYKKVQRKLNLDKYNAREKIGLHMKL